MPEEEATGLERLLKELPDIGDPEEEAADIVRPLKELKVPRDSEAGVREVPRYVEAVLEVPETARP